MRLSIPKIRRALYGTAKVLGDVQAATHDKPEVAVPKRVGRRMLGAAFAGVMKGLLPPTRGGRK